MMARVAAVLVIVSQLLLIWVALEPTGLSAIYFSFVGHPTLAVGLALAFVALTRRLRRERAAADEPSPSLPPPGASAR